MTESEWKIRFTNALVRYGFDGENASDWAEEAFESVETVPEFEARAHVLELDK